MAEGHKTLVLYPGSQQHQDHMPQQRQEHFVNHSLSSAFGPLVSLHVSVLPENDLGQAGAEMLTGLFQALKYAKQVTENTSPVWSWV